ncbi:heavy metal-binding domain-containing protein [Portibacter lacus]|uniref:C2H2-type domain-containing protein n=1 Tax=Portibacter lacus TaxID=1099794 RepID=A0AA37WDW6_9BACT|nr:heavy metal-binding domain-containing protein [Portibacter lacus]GLR17338.1 hypothetical protein GCM10007940_19530 [Portibacter lacus]
MKDIKMLLVAMSIMVFSLALGSCGNSTKSGSDADKTEQMGKEYTSAYICPMHCEGSGSDEPGKCPVCGMDYKKNDSHDSHEGHNH